MTNYPKISIITPSFNQGQFLEETILSILEQGYPNLEYIIIDGGSSDNSVEIIKKYEKSITYWESQPDRGQSHAINKGFNKATGDLITWINSDDLLMPKVLLEIYRYFEDASIILVHGRTIAFGEGRNGNAAILNTKDIEAKYLSKMVIDQPSAFFRKSALDFVGLLDEDLHYGMDFDLFVRLYLIGKFKYVDSIISKYRFHSSSKSIAFSFRFAGDWAIVYSRLCRSLRKNHFINEMKKLDLYREGDIVFEVRREIPKEIFELSWWYFLYEQIQSLYGQCRLKEVIKLINYIRLNNHRFYIENKLKVVYLRSKWTPKFIIRLARRIRTVGLAK